MRRNMSAIASEPEELKEYGMLASLCYYGKKITGTGSRLKSHTWSNALAVFLMVIFAALVTATMGVIPVIFNIADMANAALTSNPCDYGAASLSPRARASRAPRPSFPPTPIGVHTGKGWFATRARV